MGFWSGLGDMVGVGANTNSNEASQGAIDTWNNLDPFTAQEDSVYNDNNAATAAQNDALAGLQEIVDADGLTAETKADLASQQKMTADQERGQREAILANARARGVGGSGLEFASNLENQQGSAAIGAQQGFDTAALGEQQKYQALNDLGSMGTSVNQQQLDVANAQNAINAFNAANQNQYNTTQASGTANAYTGQASNYAGQGQILPNLVGSAAAAGGAAMAASDKELKEDVKDFDADQFLDSLTGYKYKYKDKKYGEGTHTGVMAQDLEQTPEGAAIVEDTPDGKMVDYGKGFGLLLATMAQMHKDMKEKKND